MVAMGITSISQVGNIYCQNTKSMDAYEEALSRGVLPIERGVAIDEDDRIRKAVIMALICQFELEYADIEGRYGILFKEYFARELEDLQHMQDDQLLAMDDHSIRVQPVGRLLIRNVCMAFDRHLNPALQAASYSKAI
jgi:oxygen-independent coproporphyrinogen-3 oxidase